MKRLALINVVGLTQPILEQLPALKEFASKREVSSFPPIFPALTCSAQTSYLTGKGVADHGIVGNGWFDYRYAETRLWKQSQRLIDAPLLWEILKKEGLPCHTAKLFWWFAMHGSTEWAITPRPLYRSDGGKVFDIHTTPMALREVIKKELGDFPFPAFWGPFSGIASSQWIANAAMWIEKNHTPHLNLVYIPHLDYCHQQYGPHSPLCHAHLEELNTLLSVLIDFFTKKKVSLVFLSEYGIQPVHQDIPINRELRKAGLLSLKNELGTETLDYGESQAFGLVDHQIAHIYVKNPSQKKAISSLLSSIHGIESVVESSQLWGESLASQRAGDLIAIAQSDAWFSYYHWLDDQKAPDFARCVDIHRKTGYDPAELFIDPSIPFPKLRIAAFLLKKKLGMRSLLELTPLNGKQVKGSHGRQDVLEDYRPICIAHQAIKQPEEVFSMLYHFFKKS